MGVVSWLEGDAFERFLHAWSEAVDDVADRMFRVACVGGCPGLGVVDVLRIAVVFRIGCLACRALDRSAVMTALEAA